MKPEYSEYQHLWGIGCARVPTGVLPYSASWRDLEADTRWTQTVLRGIGVGAGSFVHIMHFYSELVQFWPYYQAVRNLGAVYANGMPSVFDAYRIEMYLRRFKLAAAVGIAADTLTGLQQAGHDPAKVYANTAALVALPDAYPQLREMGFKPWRLLPLGPVYAIEAPDGGGARFHNREWTIESRDGQLLVSAGPQRACDFQQLETGVRGHVEKVTTPTGPESRIFVS